MVQINDALLPDSPPPRPATEPAMGDLPPAAALAPDPGVDGFIDAYARITHAAGWLLVGWTRAPWPLFARRIAGIDFAAAEAGAVLHDGPAATCFFSRNDLQDRGVGFAMLLRQRPGSPAPPRALHVREGNATLRLPCADGAAELDDPIAFLHRCIPEALHAPGRDRLWAMLGALPAPAMEDTLPPMMAEALYLLPAADPALPGDAVMVGWCADGQAGPASLFLRGGAGVAALDATHCLRLPRADVTAHLPPVPGCDGRAAGFLAFLPGIHAPGIDPVLQREDAEGHLRDCPLPPPSAGGLGGMRRILESFSLQADALDAGFDHVIGPALAAMNAHRLHETCEVDHTVFGDLAVAPGCSLIVPLHGQVGLMEIQQAILSEAHWTDVELIYILDDPPRRSEALALARSCHARFGLPFHLLILSRQLGFAPANNLAAARATGATLCFLNSDVVPDSLDWLDRLRATLADDAGLGALGARLLFEDGSLQHDGAALLPIPEAAGWMFPRHAGKGLWPELAHGLHPCEVVSAACLLMRRDMFTALGGFDEGYALGDFEDAELCRRVAAQGLRCAVQTDVSLLHLERQSQAAPDALWRRNLTLFNAWRFQRRWMGGACISAV